MVEWETVTGTVELAAVWLSAIIFLWTPPHCRARTLVIKEACARAGIRICSGSRRST